MKILRLVAVTITGALLCPPAPSLAQGTNNLSRIDTYQKWTVVEYVAPPGELSFKGVLNEKESGDERLLVRCLERGTTQISFRTTELISVFDRSRLSVRYAFENEAPVEVYWSAHDAGIGGVEVFLSSPSYPDQVKHFLARARSRKEVTLRVEGAHASVAEASFSLEGFARAYRTACNRLSQAATSQDSVP